MTVIINVSGSALPITMRHFFCPAIRAKQTHLGAPPFPRNTRAFVHITTTHVLSNTWGLFDTRPWPMVSQVVVINYAVMTVSLCTPMLNV
jgi:hypothetical protein